MGSTSPNPPRRYVRGTPLSPVGGDWAGRQPAWVLSSLEGRGGEREGRGRGGEERGRGEGEEAGKGRGGRGGEGRQGRGGEAGEGRGGREGEGKGEGHFSPKRMTILGVCCVAIPWLELSGWIKAHILTSHAQIDIHLLSNTHPH